MIKMILNIMIIKCILSIYNTTFIPRKNSVADFYVPAFQVINNRPGH